MLFRRSPAVPALADYRDYRDAYLRPDFVYRCAYCLTHEFYFGGGEGGEIDHHRPLHPPAALGMDFSHLRNAYDNLYWTCRTCNNTKSNRWPTDAEYARGERFLDPCTDDHDDHWDTRPDGTLDARTPTGWSRPTSACRASSWRRRTCRPLHTVGRHPAMIPARKHPPSPATTYSRQSNDLCGRCVACPQPTRPVPPSIFCLGGNTASPRVWRRNSLIARKCWGLMQGAALFRADLTLSLMLRKALGTPSVSPAPNNRDAERGRGGKIREGGLSFLVPPLL